MANTDSVSIFTEGTFEEQVYELVEYIARGKPDTERSTYKQSFADYFQTTEGQTPIDEDEGRKREVICRVLDSVDDLGDGSDKEIEGFFNLLFSHLISLYSSDVAKLSKLRSIVLKISNIVSQKGTAEQTSVKYRILANLFNAIPRTSSTRLAVCKALLKIASENDELDNLRLTSTDVERWLTEWDSSPEEKSEFLKSVADAFTSSGQSEAAFAFSVSHVRSLPSSESSEPTLQLIATALRIPTIFDFDSLLRLESVQALSSNELSRLLTILNHQGLEEFRKWRSQNQSVLDKYHLDAGQLERKLRLLILSEIGFSRIGENLHYSEIASALKIAESEVEKWSIDVIRTGLLAGKLSQTTQTLHVVRASPRGFGPEQWSILEERLLAWKGALVGIQNVLAASRQSMSSGLVPEQPA